MEQLNVLREHSKDLLKQLQQEKEAFVRLIDFNEGRVEEAEFQVLTGEDRSSAREASVELSELLAGNCPCLIHIKGYCDDGVSCRAFN